MAYDINFKKEAEIKLHIRRFLLYPSFWHDGTKHYMHLLQWRNLKFLQKNVSKIPLQAGIYCFVVKPAIPNFFPTQYLFYVGQTTRTLRKRFQEYLDNQQGKGKPRKKVFSMLNLYKHDIYFYFTPIPNNTVINEVEDKLINMFVPHINTQIPEAKISPELQYIYE
ncbi:MAG: GIY-YIG nuclease family protein [Sphingobacteriales bacterium]|nr:MAG: GIY-YIG nuclease family protein [Sphingobacteriales bacterium]